MTGGGGALGGAVGAGEGEGGNFVHTIHFHNGHAQRRIASIVNSKEQITNSNWGKSQISCLMTVASERVENPVGGQTR